MADNKLIARADEVYDILISELDSKKWNYKEDRKNRSVSFNVNGDLLPVAYNIIIDAERQLIKLRSVLPFDVKDDEAYALIFAVCRTNCCLTDGRFKLILENRTVLFDMTCSYIDSLIGEEVFDFLIFYTFIVVNKYNSRLRDLNEGTIDIQKYIEKITE